MLPKAKVKAKAKAKANPQMAKSEPETERIIALFKEFDRDGNGTIDTAELAAVLQLIGTSKAHVGKLMDEMDSNGDGFVDYVDFANWVTAGSEDSRLVLAFGLALDRAAEAISNADALLICSGAGLGVDGGLGTFRGRNAGFWPPMKAMDLSFSELSMTFWFEVDPRLAWSYWHFRYHAYAAASPHEGYSILARWGNAMPAGFFSVTSNVDGHWLRTPGVNPERVYECHGAITHAQGLHRGEDDPTGVWQFDPADIAALHVPEWDLVPGESVHALVNDIWMAAVVADDGCVLLQPESEEPLEDVRGVRRSDGLDLVRVADDSVLPHVPGDKAKLARPNNMMFRDENTNMSRIWQQRSCFDAWCKDLPNDTRLVIVEVGAGSALPTMRILAAHEMVAKYPNSTLVRINLDEYDVSTDVAEGAEDRAIGIGGLGALEVIQELDKRLNVLAPGRFSMNDRE